ncbi:MAG: hypothetical protein V3S46_02775 [Nitrospinota bacterium]
MELEKIYIDFEVHKEIEKRRKSFSETPNDILRQVFSLPEVNAENKIESKKNSHADFIRRGIKPGLYTNGILLPNGMKLKSTFRGRKFEAEVKSGKIVYSGKTYNSLSGAGCVVTDGSINGWALWHYFDEKTNRWRPCKNLRQSK